MPKRGGKRDGRNNWRSDHYEHDTREQDRNVRRITFKTSKGRNNHKFKKINLANLSLDDDIDMGGHSGLSHRGGRTNTPLPRGPNKFYKPQFQPGMGPWYQITIPFGGKYEKTYVIKALLSHLSPDIFIPHYYKVIGNAAVFYVDDVKMAEKLYYADRKITFEDGFKMAIRLRNTTPNIEMTDELKEKIKLTMARRYNPATKALDLTKFHSDPSLEDVFCALFRPVVMIAVINIIEENIPDLEALNLNDNKIQGMDHMKTIPQKLKNLKILYLGDNRIGSVHHLEALKGLALVELYLKGNPLVSRCRDYVSDVRRKFPRLLKLDGMDLPPTIGFDGEDEAIQLPARQQSFLINPQGQELVREFLTQYFLIYDSETRQQLLEAYHEQAMFSMNAAYYNENEKQPPSQRLGMYFNNSRNLLRLTDRNVRRRSLKTGKLQVVSLLEDMPKSQHDLQGFCVDLVVFTPTMITLTLNGVFKERTGEPNTHPIRSFHRTMIIVPNNGGFCIVNDMLFITNATKEQEAKAFSTSLPTVETPTAAVPIVAAPDAVPNQAQLVATLSQHTGMNMHWSTNCLQETNWDYQRAIFIFTQLKEQGKIPPEAFVK